MKISNQTDRLEAKFGTLASVRMNCEAGFEAVDYSMYNATSAVFAPGGSSITAEMKRVASSYGVGFNQTHAPFSRFKLGRENEDENRRIFYSIMRAMEVTAELEAPIVIVHPSVICPHLPCDERFDMNMEFFGKLIPRAKNLGIKIAIENMWGRHKDEPSRIVKDVCSDAAELIRYIDALPSDIVCACLDVGHSGLVGESADEMALALGDRLLSLHIHDNDFYHDEHTLPYLGKINFPAFIKALRRIGYKGDITLEANEFLKGFPDELYPAALNMLSRVAAYIRDEVEK